jgi:hypothetical protein
MKWSSDSYGGDGAWKKSGTTCSSKRSGIRIGMVSSKYYSPYLEGVVKDSWMTTIRCMVKKQVNEVE